MSSPGERQARRLAAEQRTAPTRRSLARGLACGLALLFFGAAGAWTGIARAQVPSRLPLAERAAIQAVISAQMDAFGRDAGDEAFAFASPGIQALFGSAAHFMDMVRAGYQPVYRPRAAAFGELLDWDGRLVQTVRVVGPDGAAVVALYDMERQPDGSWRISGCSLVRQPAGEA
jgi:hypothetical protein